MIEGIAGEFRRGRLVRIEAPDEDDREFLAGFLARDRGAARLGEVALVDNSSRVGAAGARLLHDAPGRERRGPHRVRARLRRPRGPGAPAANRSVVHLDVMVGAPEMDVEAVDGRGRTVTIIADGSFAPGL